MPLPGISREQMIEIDRIMVEDYNIPIELMMEHAGLNLARFAIKGIINPLHVKINVIIGSGNNGGGGIVAARRLTAWGIDTGIFIPRGIERMKKIPKLQLRRAKNVGTKVKEGLPRSKEKNSNKIIILDCYTGYNYEKKNDIISNQVFNYYKGKNNIIALDVPSGFDVNTGETEGQFEPSSTLSLAFIKKGIFHSPRKHLGKLFLVDIGVPTEVYRSKIGIKWESPYDLDSLKNFEIIFRNSSIQSVYVSKKSDKNLFWWDIQDNN